MKKILFILLIGMLSILSMVSAFDEEIIQGCFGDNELIGVCTPGDEELFFIGKQTFPKTNFTEVLNKGGGGGGSDVSILQNSLGLGNISTLLCNLTYESANKNPIDYSKIGNIQDEFFELTNLTKDWTGVRLYIDNWQGLCSDLLQKSLNEKYLCGEIYDMVIETDYNYYLDEIIKLKKIIEPTLHISEDLLIKYINDYDMWCYETGFSLKLDKIKIIETLVIGDVESSITSGTIICISILFFLILIVFLFFSYNEKKRKLIILTFKKKFS